VHIILKEKGIRPPPVKTFTVSRDPGGRRPPCPLAVVLSVGRSMKSSHAETWPHDDRRNGTVPRLPRPCRREDRARNPGARHPRHPHVDPDPRVAEGPDGRHPDSRVLLQAVPARAEEGIAAIKGSIRHHKVNHARSFRWSRRPEDRVEAEKRGHHKLQEMAASE